LDGIKLKKLIISDIAEININKISIFFLFFNV